MASSILDLYTISPEPELKKNYVNTDLKNVPGPAAVLDLAKVRSNCLQQLRAVDYLSVSFRAHVKTHKTVQLAKLQVGEEPHRPVRVIVSTIPEAFIMLPWLKECKAAGRDVSVLYGIAPSSTCFAAFKPFREAEIPIAYMIDHPAQIANLVDQELLASTSTSGVSGSSTTTDVYIKIDTGYHRAGLGVKSAEFETVLQAISQHSMSNSSFPHLRLLGLYSHLGSSYSASTPDEALEFLQTELDEGFEAIQYVESLGLTFRTAEESSRRLTLSVGATPTASAAQNLLSRSESALKVEKSLNRIKEIWDVELHAGVYPALDVQQVATHARPERNEAGYGLDWSDISFSILAEVLSLYPERPEPQVLVGAGVLALGREPAKNYSGWGIVAPSPWRKQDSEPETIFDESNRTGWIVGKLAQEHGLLNWQGDSSQMRMPKIGDKLLIWPNHACIAGAQFGWYYVVDSDLDRTKIADIWVRARGW